MTVAQSVRCWGMLVLGLTSSGCLRSPETKSARYIEAGRKLLREKDPGRAILQFRNAVQSTPRNPEVYYQLGMAYIATREFRPALAAFRKTLELDPKHVEARLRIAQMMTASNDPGLMRDAQSQLTALLESSSATPEILNTLALTELRLGDPEKASQNLEQALTQSPAGLDSSVMLAWTRLSQNDIKGAEEVLKKACNDAPTSADARRVLGEFYVGQKRIPEAETQFRRALGIDPNWGSALLHLGRLQLANGKKEEAELSFKKLATLDSYEATYAIFLFQEGRHDEAIRELERLAKANSDDRRIRTDLVLAYRTSKRSAEATKVLDDALRKNPKDTDALLQRGEISLSLARYAEAEVDLNQVLRLEPNTPEVHYLLAKLSQARGAILTYRQELSSTLTLNPRLQVVRVELAQSMLDNNAGAHAALNLLDAAPQDQKASTPIIVARNWALWMLGDFAAMRKEIDRGLMQGRSPDLLIQDGLLRLRTGDSSEARTALEEALKIDPTDLRALKALAQTYVSQKNPSVALQKVKEYAARQPKSAPIQDFLGELLVAHGQRAEARAAFSAATAAAPGIPKSMLSLVQLDVADGKIEDATKRLEALLATDGDNSTANLWLGVLKEMKGDDKTAMEQYRKAIAAKPNSAQAANNLAYLLVEHGQQLDEALKYAQSAVQTAPDRLAYADTLGWALYHKGLYTPAIQYLSRAGADSANVVWKYHLAMAYAKSGDTDLGRATLNAALKLNPNLPEAKIARKVVDETR